MQGTTQTKVLLFRYLLLSITDADQFAWIAWEEFINSWIQWYRKYAEK
ncbi:MAG: hypothetical protein IJ834_07125 [Paludibacteraceae bacterium]|nr:hypothetical protein [Paludibacteraceae bacterium]